MFIKKTITNFIVSSLVPAISLGIFGAGLGSLLFGYANSIVYAVFVKSTFNLIFIIMVALELGLYFFLWAIVPGAISGILFALIYQNNFIRKNFYGWKGIIPGGFWGILLGWGLGKYGTSILESARYIDYHAMWLTETIIITAVVGGLCSWLLSKRFIKL